MQRIMGLDPGCELSAWIIYRHGHKIPFNGFGKEPNEAVRNRIISMADHYDILVLEKVAPYINPYAAHGGMSGDIITTAIEIGRFIQVADDHKKEHVLIFRKTVVTQLTGNQRGNDSLVRKALIARFGEQGTKNNPGGTYGIAQDVWSALAVAVSFCDKNVIQPSSEEEAFQPGFL